MKLEGPNSPIDNGLGAPPPGGPSVSPLQRIGKALGLSPLAFSGPIRPIDWLVPLLLVVVVQFVSAMMVQELVLDAAHEQMLEQWDSRPQTGSAQSPDEAWTFAEKTIKISAVAGSILLVPFASLLTSLLLMLVLNFGMGGSARFAPLWFMSCLAWLPKGIETILFTFLAKTRGSIEVTFSPAVLVPSDNRLVHSVLGIFDLFDFWMIAIQVVGVAAVLAIPKRQARTAVVILWIAWWIIRIGLAVLGARSGATAQM